MPAYELLSRHGLEKMSDEDKRDDIGGSDQKAVTKPDSLAQDQSDWTLETMSKHPAGLESAIMDNISRMEQETLALIENGSAEDIARALEENTNQLRMLQERISKMLG